MSTIILILILTIILAPLLYYGPYIIIRALARRAFYWTFTPENTFSVIVTEEKGTKKDPNAGGNIVDVLHGITGRTIDTSDPDPMEWVLVDNEPDPKHEKRLYKKIGAQSMGSVFYKPRINIDKRARFAREEDKRAEEAEEAETIVEEPLHTVTKVVKTRHIYFTGELTVPIKESDTADKLGLDFDIDFAFERRYPVRSVLRLADAPAFLTSLVEAMVNNKTVNLPAGAYIGGGAEGSDKSTEEFREELANDIRDNEEFKEKVLEVIGFDIKSVSIRDVSMSLRHRRLLELQVEAEKEGEAEVIRARKQKEANLEINTADADRVERVIKPASENDRTVRVREAEAYEKNEVVTTYAPGASTMVPLQE